MGIEQPVALLGIRGVETQPQRCGRPPADQTALDVALQVEHQIETLASNRAQKGDKSPQAARPVVDQDIVQGRMIVQQRGCGRLDRPGNMAVGIGAPNPHQQRQGSGDIADCPEQDDQDALGARHAQGWRGGSHGGLLGSVSG